AFESLGDEMFNNSGITGLTFAEGITRIPANFANNCTNLTTVILPSTLKTIGSYAFANCSSLANMTLNDGLETIGTYAFNYANPNSFGDTLTIPSSVVRIENYAFQRICPSVFDLSNASNLTYLGSSAFNGTSYSSKYVTLLLPDETNSSLESYYGSFIGHRFIGDFSLVLNSSSPYIEFAGHCAQYITSLSVKNINSSGSTNVGNYFGYQAYQLENVYIDQTVTRFGNSVFYSATNLKSIYIDGAIGESGRTEVVYFGSNPFYGLSSTIKSNINVYVAAADVDAYRAHSVWGQFNILPHTTNVSVTFNSLFGTAPATQSVQVATGHITNPGDLTCSEGYTFKGYYTYSNSDGYTKIDDFSALSFYNDTTIYCLWDGVDITQYLTFSSTTYNGVSGYAITGYTENLKYFPDLVIPRQYNGKDIVTINAYAFKDANFVNTIDFASNSNLQYMTARSFQNMANLKVFTFPASIKQANYSTFDNCKKLYKLVFKGDPTDLLNFTYSFNQNGMNVSELGLIDSNNYTLYDGFIYDKYLTTLYMVPKAMDRSVVTLPNTVRILSYYALSSLQNVTHIYLDETKLTHIYGFAFANSNNLQFINDNSLVLQNVELIDRYSFNKTPIKTISIGNTLSYLSGDSVFNNCQNLTDVYINSTNVQSIGFDSRSIFDSSRNLKNLTFVVGGNIQLSWNFFYNIGSSLEYIHLGASNYLNNGLFNNGNFNNLKTLVIDGYPSNSSSSLFNNLPNNLNIIVKRSTYSTWMSNPTGFNLSRFNIYPDEFEVTFQNDYDPANCYSEMHLYGDTDITLPVVTVTKAEGLYDFIGWYYKNENNLSMPYTGQALIKDTTIFAVYDLPTEYLFGYEYDDENYTATIIRFDEADQFSAGALVLPSRTQHNGEQYRVTAVANNVFQGKTTISSITIPEGYVSIGDYAFEGASYLSRVTLPTSLYLIGS
ncbi:MAG: leucine-rich repeat protein, partial [Clostridia bacterium]|nr:leucine-rich repeat protein [Clostridia bacterium]